MLGAYENTRGDQPLPADQLTGLPTRASFIPELNRLSGEHPGNFALVFADIDGLKATNDAYGHPAGDELLKTAAQAIQETVRHDPEERKDHVGRGVFRLSGDEFVVMLTGVNNQEEVNTAIGRVRENLLQKGIRASMGGRPHRDGEKPEELLADVDRMMYAEKQARKKVHKQELVESLSMPRKTAFWLGRKLLRYSGVRYNINGR